MKRPKILVTGAAGYVGSVLVPALLRRGFQVRVFDKLIFGESSLALVRRQIELIRGDILEPPDDLMDGVSGVIHLAGLSSQSSASYHNPRYTDRVNHLGTEVIARLAKSRGVPRFVFASSCSLYGGPGNAPTAASPPLHKEDDRIDVAAPYALSKRAAEETLLELTDDSFRPTILRKGTLYGFSPKMRYDLVLNAFTKDAFTRKRITVHAGGEAYRPLLDLQDAVTAYLAALALPLDLIGGAIFNVVNMNERIVDLASSFQAILKTHKAVDIELDVQPPAPALSYRAAPDKFKAMFKLDPVRSLDEAIMETWKALEEGHDHEDPRYYNDRWHTEALSQGLL